jgi:tetratricopeptide (TPR) repeat protein
MTDRMSEMQQPQAQQPQPQRIPLEKASELAWEHFRAGRLEIAERIARQILEKQPNRADAVQLIGVVAYRTGRMDEAIDFTERALKLLPHSAPLHGNLCEMYRVAGRIDEAVEAGRKALELKPDHAQAANNLGIAYFDRREWEESERLYRQALAANPEFAEAWNNLGNVLRMQKRPEEALPAFDKATALKPNYPEAYNNKGGALRDLKRYDEAEASYRRAIAIKPGYVEAFNNLAVTLWEHDKRDEAIGVLSRAMATDPDRVEPLVLMATLLQDQGQPQGALAAIQRVLKMKPDHVPGLNLLGRILRDLEDLPGAIAAARRAIELKPDFAEGLNSLGISLMEIGDLDGAKEAFDRALAIEPDSLRTHINLAAAKKFTADDPAFAFLEKAAERLPEMPEEQQLALHYALGKAYDDVKRYEPAFRHFLAGAKIKRKTLKYEEAGTLRLFDRIRQIFTKKLIDEKRGPGNPDDSSIFIVGMPRSGSTLTEQIIASHPRVFGAGEIKLLHKVVQELDKTFGGNVRYPELIHLMEEPQFELFSRTYLERRPRSDTPGKDRVTDKMLTNYYYIGLIHLALPNAKIVHTRRSAVDTCISCFSKSFKDDMPYTYDLAELARYYRKYDELMRHWHAVLPPGTLIDVQYEDVVADVEGQARRLLDHLGLEWHDSVLEFHKTERIVKTASVTQVRQPLYSSSVERWRNYGPEVLPLIQALGPLAPAGANAPAA